VKEFLGREDGPFRAVSTVLSAQPPAEVQAKALRRVALKRPPCPNRPFEKLEVLQTVVPVKRRGVHAYTPAVALLDSPATQLRVDEEGQEKLVDRV